MKPKASRRTNNKKTSSRVVSGSAFRNSLFTPVRALMFILAFAIIGTWYLVATHADAGYGVRFVLFCASDSCSGSQGELQGYANEIHDWYQNQSGITFQNLGATTYHSPTPAGAFGGSGYGTNATWDNIRGELSGAGLMQDNIKTVVLLGFRSMSNCGVASFGGDLAVVDRFKGKGECLPAPDMAHELGHALGFPGADSDGMHDSDGMLMHEPLACAGKPLSQCSLNQTDRNYVKSSPWFSSGPSAAETGVITGYRGVGFGGGFTSFYRDRADGSVGTTVADSNSAFSQSRLPFTYSQVTVGTHTIFSTSPIVQDGVTYDAIGYTLCDNVDGCHTENNLVKTNPASVNVAAGHTYYVNFHYVQRGTPPPSGDDTSLTVKVAGYGGETLMSAKPSSDGIAHQVGRCNELADGYQFKVTVSRFCPGTKIGPIAIAPPNLGSKGYNFSGWSGCDKVDTGICYMGPYDGSAKTITATYTSTTGNTGGGDDDGGDDPQPTVNNNLNVKVTGFSWDGEIFGMNSVTNKNGSNPSQIGKCTGVAREPIDAGFPRDYFVIPSSGSRTCTGYVGPAAIDTAEFMSGNSKYAYGWTFAGWTGCAGGVMGVVCYVGPAGTSAQTVTAKYTQNPPVSNDYTTLIIKANGPPSVTMNLVGYPATRSAGALGYYGECTNSSGKEIPEGSQTKIFAVAGYVECQANNTVYNSNKIMGGYGIAAPAVSGYTFSGWTGCPQGTSGASGNTCNITEYNSGTKTVTANYTVNNTTPPPPLPPPKPSDPPPTPGCPKPPTNPTGKLAAGGPFTVSYYDYRTGAGATGANTNFINSNWGTCAPFPGIGTDYFHALYQATYKAPAAGTYTFYSEQDDGFALKINNVTLIDAWTKPAASGQGTVKLLANQGFTIAAGVYDVTGNAKVVLYWSGPGINGKQIFPSLGPTAAKAPATCNALTKLFGCK